MDDKHDARIQLTEDIGILMSYPHLGSVSKVETNEGEGQMDSLFNMVYDCMYQIWQGEETFDAMDYNHKDKQEFLESLNHEQFEKIQNFFQTMPTVKHDVEVTNPKTKVTSTISLEGMNSFF